MADEKKIDCNLRKWRGVYETENYAIIRSCIKTYKKNNVNVFHDLKQSFLNGAILV